MKRKYPTKLFCWGILINFLFRFFFLFAPGVLLSILGIWVKPCLQIGLAVLAIDLALSVIEQIRIRKSLLTPSDNPDLNAMVDALTGPGGVDALLQVVDEKIKAAQAVEEEN